MVALTPLRDSAAVLLAFTAGVAPPSWVSECTAAGLASKEDKAGVEAASLPAALLAAAKASRKVVQNGQGNKDSPAMAAVMSMQRL